ncbi:hypothetical protein [Rivularia sp. UHCC 0363]|uniref:hypothetical protein n=1 Tax=Rivularia sp. UHCC 0363 TaxID=3110244 RepID=UPI002B1EDC0B|nr:hypothetical protein [Rivularia sp. UHCC 0363]MEA5598606.1 hypothetical protein [Rivularia sp. UHCC 0363]
MPKLKIIFLIICLLMLLLSGCSPSKGNDWTQKFSHLLGDDYRITLYSGGNAVREWQLRDGIVNYEERDDGWFFSCKKHLVIIRGEEIVIEPLIYSQQQVENPIICN